MPKYLLSIMQPDGDPPPPEVMEPIWRAVTQFSADLAASGSWVFNEPLYPADVATVVRSRDGETLVTDGPYVEAREHVGGLVIVDVPDLDGALAWAKRAAEATTLPIEVRPFRSFE
jgi:hypothetical protein